MSSIDFTSQFWGQDLSYLVECSYSPTQINNSLKMAKTITTPSGLRMALQFVRILRHWSSTSMASAFSILKLNLRLLANPTNKMDHPTIPSPFPPFSPQVVDKMEIRRQLRMSNLLPWGLQHKISKSTQVPCLNQVQHPPVDSPSIQRAHQHRLEPGGTSPPRQLQPIIGDHWSCYKNMGCCLLWTTSARHPHSTHKPPSQLQTSPTRKVQQGMECSLDFGNWP